MIDIIRLTKKSKCIMIICMLAVLMNSIRVCAANKNSSGSISLSGKYAVIMDGETGEIIYKKNAKTKCHNASTTKLMTAIVAVEENDDLKKKVKISGNAAGTDGVKLGMNAGEKYYMKDMISAMLILSACDCAVAVAEGTSGSVDKFMKLTNKKVKELGCKNTRFGTPSGLRSSKTHYTTAYDLALITKYAYDNDTIRKMLKKKSYSFKSAKGRKRSVKTTNFLLDSKKYYCVGKTGSGWTAKYCFAGVYTYKKHPYVITVLGSSGEYGRWSDTKKLIDYCRSYEKNKK